MRRVYRVLLVGSIVLVALMLTYLAKVMYEEAGILGLVGEVLDLADELLVMLMMIPVTLIIVFTPYAVYWVIRYKILKRKRKKAI